MGWEKEKSHKLHSPFNEPMTLQLTLLSMTHNLYHPMTTPQEIQCKDTEEDDHLDLMSKEETEEAPTPKTQWMTEEEEEGLATREIP